VLNDAAPLKHPRRAAFCGRKLVGRYVELVKCDASRLSTSLPPFRSASLTIDEPIIRGSIPIKRSTRARAHVCARVCK